jgi:hypothetical protein
LQAVIRSGSSLFSVKANSVGCYMHWLFYFCLDVLFCNLNSLFWNWFENDQILESDKRWTKVINFYGKCSKIVLENSTFPEPWKNHPNLNTLWTRWTNDNLFPIVEVQRFWSFLSNSRCIMHGFDLSLYGHWTCSASYGISNQTDR